MAGLGPRVVLTPPPLWTTAEVAPPRIAESAGAELVAWNVVASLSGDAALASGCVATPIPGWVEEMRSAVEGRTTALAGAAAERITGSPVDARARPVEQNGQGSVFVLRAASALDAPPIGLARTYVGFDAPSREANKSRVFTCFATCASRKGGPAGCEAAVEEARLEGSGPPPAPGAALAGVTWGIHHPRPTAVGAAIAVLALGIAAVLLRRRPRSLRP